MTVYSSCNPDGCDGCTGCAGCGGCVGCSDESSCPCTVSGCPGCTGPDPTPFESEIDFTTGTVFDLTAGNLNNLIPYDTNNIYISTPFTVEFSDDGFNFSCYGMTSGDFAETILPQPFLLDAIHGSSHSMGAPAGTYLEYDYINSGQDVVMSPESAGVHLIVKGLNMPYSASQGGSEQKAITGIHSDSLCLWVDDGEAKLYAIGYSSENTDWYLREYNLTTDYETPYSNYVATLANEVALNIPNAATDNTYISFQFNSDKSKLLVATYEGRQIYQYPLATAGDLSTMGAVEATVDLSGTLTNLSGLRVPKNNKRIFFCDPTGGNIYQYDFVAGSPAGPTGTPGLRVSSELNTANLKITKSVKGV